MGQTEISELERLVKQNHLVAQTEYQNPNRDRSMFFNFVRNYAADTSVEIHEVEFGLTKQLKQAYHLLSYWLHAKNVPLSDRIYNIANFGSRLFLAPIRYPFFGGGHSYEYVSNELYLIEPTHKGIQSLFIDLKVHEYLHAFHFILAKDLNQRGLISTDGFDNVSKEWITYQHWKTPTPAGLKKYESKLIRKMIDAELSVL